MNSKCDSFEFAMVCDIFFCENLGFKTYIEHRLR